MGQDILNRGMNRSAADVLKLFWAAKIYVLALFLILGALAALWLAMQPKYYRAQMFIGPAEAMFAPSEEPVYEAQDVYAGTPLYKMQRRDTNLAFQHAIKYMRGQDMAMALNAHMPALLTYFTDEHSAILPWKKRYDLAGEDTANAALTYILKERVHIQPDGLTPFYRVTFETRDQALAINFMRALYDYTDDGLRKAAQKDVKARLAYLRERMRDARSSDKKLLTALILQEENALMLTEAGGAFALRLIEAPSVMPSPVWPRPFLIYAAVALVSLLLGASLYSLKEHA